MLASFVKFYPNEFRGGDCSWPWFLYLLRYMPGARALEQLDAAKGIGAGFSGGDAVKDIVSVATKEPPGA